VRAQFVEEAVAVVLQSKEGCIRPPRSPDRLCSEGQMFTILWIIAAILVVFWIIGLAVHVLGAFIHILLVLAIIAFIVGFITRSR
jgi:hypothetical protein